MTFLALALAMAGAAHGRWSGSAPMETSGYRVELNKLYQKTGLTKDSAGRSCGELLTLGRSSL